MPTASVTISIGVHSWKRIDDKPFRPTRSWGESFHYRATTEDYLQYTASIANDIWNYVQVQRSFLAENAIVVGITIANVTHPTPAAGVVPLAKQHIDYRLSGQEFNSAQVLSDQLDKHIADLKQKAKY